MTRPHDEIGPEHGSGDFMAICAVADETVDETWCLGGEFQLHSAAETGCCCFRVGGPAVCCFACEWDVGFCLVGGSERHFS